MSHSLATVSLVVPLFSVLCVLNAFNQLVLTRTLGNLVHFYGYFPYEEIGRIQVSYLPKFTYEVREL